VVVGMDAGFHCYLPYLVAGLHGGTNSHCRVARSLVED
jgi:hypothetical protein